jgi:hypothetical protein
MRLHLRFSVLAGGLALVLAACSSPAAPSATTATPSPIPTDAPGAREAFGAAVCPVFTDLVALDPRLAALRAAGEGGGDVSAEADEVGAVGEELGRLLEELEAAPAWSGGNRLRLELITALHGIHAHLLAAGDDASAAELAAIPFVAGAGMDQAMADAVGAGLSCGEPS